MYCLGKLSPLNFISNHGTPAQLLAGAAATSSPGVMGGGERVMLAGRGEMSDGLGSAGWGGVQMQGISNKSEQIPAWCPHVPEQTNPLQMLPACMDH